MTNYTNGKCCSGGRGGLSDGQRICFVTVYIYQTRFRGRGGGGGIPGNNQHTGRTTNRIFIVVNKRSTDDEPPHAVTTYIHTLPPPHDLHISHQIEIDPDDMPLSPSISSSGLAPSVSEAAEIASASPRPPPPPPPCCCGHCWWGPGTGGGPPGDAQGCTGFPEEAGNAECERG